MVSEFIKTLDSENKSFEYIQSSLRSAKQIYEQGGNVTMKYSDREFSLQYDNRRLIIDNSNEPSENLLDSKPLESVEDCEDLRSLKSLVKETGYSRYSPTKTTSKKYKNVLETAARTFIKGLLAETELYGLDRTLLPTYNDIINYIKDYDCEKGIANLSKMQLTKSSISHLKNRKTITKSVPDTKETRDFASYLESKFPNFKRDEFIR